MVFFFFCVSSCLILLGAFVCMSSVCAYVHVLHFLNSLLMLSMVEFGALVGLLEVELPPGPVSTGIAVLSAVSFTESLPFLGGAALGINVVLKQSDVQVYSASSQRQVFGSGQCTDRIPCLLPVIDKLWHDDPCSIS